MPLVMSHAEGTPLYTQPAGAAAEGVIVAASLAVIGPRLPDSKQKDVVLKMAQPFQQKNGIYPPQFAFDGYGAVQLIAAAIKQAGNANPQDIQRALNNLTLLTPEGEYRYTPQDHAGLAEYFEHDLVCMRGAGIARAVDEAVPRRRVVGIGITESAHADAGAGMGGAHRECGAPDAQASRRRFVDRHFGTLQCAQAALDARTEAGRVVPRERADRTETDRERGDHAEETPRVARLVPGEQRTDERIRQPRRTRAGEQDRYGEQQESDDRSASAETRARREQREG